MKLTKLYNEFFNSEKSGGLVLLLVTILSLVISNSSWSNQYISFWHTDMGGHSLAHWINDGLMTIFFLLIGLELEREIYIGELSSIKNASLPFIGAIGGMLVPAGLFFLINKGTETQAGVGIPMATDIAFAIGILSLLGSRVPATLKIFLTALAVIDDLGAIIVIAVFYTSSLSVINLSVAILIFAILLLLNRLKITNLIPYIIGGIAMWYFMLHSGVHATITGVLLSFAIPFKNGGDDSPSYKLQHLLHKPVAFIILPVFALANTCLPLNGVLSGNLLQANSIGIFSGLVLGKPLGICLFTFLGSLIGICTIPKSINWTNIMGVGFLAGIGFTMSIFITLLAYSNESVINNSKIAILISSLTAGTIGYLILKFTLKVQNNTDLNEID